MAAVCPREAPGRRPRHVGPTRWLGHAGTAATPITGERSRTRRWPACPRCATAAQHSPLGRALAAQRRFFAKNSTAPPREGGRALVAVRRDKAGGRRLIVEGGRNGRRRGEKRLGLWKWAEAARWSQVACVGSHLSRRRWGLRVNQPRRPWQPTCQLRRCPAFERESGERLLQHFSAIPLPSSAQSEASTRHTSASRGRRPIDSRGERSPNGSVFISSEASHCNHPQLFEGSLKKLQFVAVLGS